MVVSTSECPIRDILGRVGGRWVVDILVHLDAEPQHFSALNRAIAGISRRMLTLSLRGLERDGIITRTVRPGNVRVVEYAITPLGRELSAQMVALSLWSRSRYSAIYDAREAYDRANGTALAAS